MENLIKEYIAFDKLFEKLCEDAVIENTSTLEEEYLFAGHNEVLDFYENHYKNFEIDINSCEINRDYIKFGFKPYKGDWLYIRFLIKSGEDESRNNHFLSIHGWKNTNPNYNEDYYI